MKRRLSLSGVLASLIFLLGTPHLFAQKWYPLGPSVTTEEIKSQLGLVSSLWVDETDFKTIYAGSNTGGIFATYDGGENWHSLSDNHITTGVLAIEADPENKKHLYIGTGHWGFNRAYGKGVLMSPDAGVTWLPTGLNNDNIPGGSIIQDLKFHPDDHDTLYAMLNTEFKGKTCIFRSLDKAENWDIVFEQQAEELFDFVQSPADPDLILATGSLLLMSKDAGTQWEDITYRLNIKRNHKVARICVDFMHGDSESMLVVMESYDSMNPGLTEQSLYKSDDCGLSFKRLFFKSMPMLGYWKMEIKASYAEPDEFYLGGIWLYKYKIKGDTASYMKYDNHKYHKDVRDLLVFEGEKFDRLVMGNDGGVTRSDDGAVTWYDISRNGLQNTQFHNITLSENSNTIFCGPQDGNLCFYTHTSGTWWIEGHIGDAYDGMIDYEDPSIVYMVTLPRKSSSPYEFLLKSLDGGQYFTYRRLPDTTEKGRYNIPVAMHPENSKTIYAGLKNLWCSTDGADNWHRISNFTFPNEQKIQALGISRSDPSTICIGFENPTWGNINESKVFITRNHGAEWHDITPRGSLSLDWGSVTDILIHPNNPNIIYLTIDRTWTNRRVYVTYDGGNKWQNFSEGIPAIPVNAIRYFKGGDYDMFFIGTDAGVYYRDEIVNQWVPFGEGLPLTIVSDIEIDYKRKKLVAGTFGRGLWEVDLCLPVEPGELEISGNIDWPEGKNLLQSIILLPGTKVTMHSTIEVGDGVQITVMPGAHLILDGAKLTNNCHGYWEGIKVYGHPDYSAGQPQGKITMINGAVIENARYAIDLMTFDESSRQNNLSGGGIVEAENASIINSLRALFFRSAKGKNPSKFVNTRFVVNKILWNDEPYLEAVRIIENNGIVFDGCSIINEVSLGVQPSIKRGCGIYSFNSSFRIINSYLFGTSTPFAEIRGYRTGIRALTSSPGYSVRISDINFRINYTSIYLSGYSACGIMNNTFNINTIFSGDTIPKPVTAVYLDHCDALSIVSNTFKCSTLGGGLTGLAGVVVNDCGENNNLILNNLFTLFDYSVLAQNKNRSENGDKGLRLYHNRFIDNKYDICITNSAPESSGQGIAYYLGIAADDALLTAANSFSNNKLYPFSDLFNEGEKLVYNYTEKVQKNAPLFHTNIWMRNVEHINGTSTDSAVLFSTDSYIAERERVLWQDRYENAHEYSWWVVDGGNTAGLTESVKFTNHETSLSTYNRLRQLDSKLSAPVISELLNNNLFNNTLLIDVLTQNPVIFRNEYLFDLLNNRQPLVPGYLLAKLNNLHTKYSMVEDLESRWQNYRAFRDHYFNTEVIDLHQESAAQYGLKDGGAYTDFNDGRSELTELLDSRGYFNDKMFKSFHLLNMGQIAEALQNLQDLKAEYPEQASGIQKLIELNTSGFPNSDIGSITNGQINEITSSVNDDLAGIFANNLLMHFEAGNYTEPYIFPNKAPAIIIPEFEFEEFRGHSFKIYPQPASEFLIIEYKYELGPKDGNVKIFDLTGKIVKTVKIEDPFGQKIIDVSDLLSGVYIIRLTDTGRICAEQKLMIY